jgi:hypothetical protein
VFLGYIDSFTPWHIAILKYFEDPAEWVEKHGLKLPSFHMGSPSTLLEMTFKELQGMHDTYGLFVKDLYARGLLSSDSLDTTMSEAGMYASRTTELGRRFIKFITSPVKE